MEDKAEDRPTEQDDKLIKTIQTVVGVALLIALNGFLIYHATENVTLTILQLLVLWGVTGFSYGRDRA